MSAQTKARAIDIVEAGKQLGIGRSLAYELAKRGEFPVRVLRIGRLYRVSQSELDAYLAGGGE